MKDKNFSLKKQKIGRAMYIAEAALEYLISILVASSYLATLTKSLGMSDSLTGILSSIISLGGLFQLLSISIRKTRVKRLVMALSIINQLLFMLLYVIPVTAINSKIKIVLFVVSILCAYILYNLAHPKKINWLMSLVEDSHRGSFTANKEIISLISGIVFSFCMGAVIDHFKDKGEIRTAFILSAAVIFVLMILHTLSMLFTVEPEQPQTERKTLLAAVRSLAGNKDIIHITIIFVLYYIATYISIPFYGTYLIGELGLSLKFVSVLTIVSSISRILVSKLWGKYADKKSFAAMTEKCLIVLSLAYACAFAATPLSGKYMFILYYIIHGIALGGINSALINLIFDYVSPDKRADSLAICQAASGVAGFLATLAVSPLVSHIQTNGNTVFGIPMYAQQFLSLISLVLTVITIIYVKKVILKP